MTSVLPAGVRPSRSPWSMRPDGSRRLVGIDLARCLALVGMMCTHLLRARDPDGQVTLVQQVAGGRASALFAVLAGVSIALVSGRMKPATGIAMLRVRLSLTVRAFLIAGLGLWLGGLDTRIAVILTAYGLLFLLGLPFLGLGTRPLALLAGAWLVVSPSLSHLLRPHLPRFTGTVPSSESLDGLWSLACELAFTGYYPAVPWLTYLLAGMAVGRLDLRRADVARRLTLAGAALAAAAWLVSRYLTSVPAVQDILRRTRGSGALPPWPRLEQELIDGLFGTTPTGSWWWLSVVAPHSGTPLDLAQTIGSALVVIGGCLLLTRRATRLWAVLGGAGAMTLTLYTLHVVLMVPSAWPPEQGALTRHLVLVLAVGAFFAVARLRGPLELVVGWAGTLTARLAARLVT